MLSRSSFDWPHGGGSGVEQPVDGGAGAVAHAIAVVAFIMVFLLVCLRVKKKKLSREYVFIASGARSCTV